MIDTDKSVPEDSYTKEKGSVVITLSADYLETLPEGEHTVKANFSDGSAETVLTVKAGDPKVPATGVEDNAVLYRCVMIVSMMSLALLILLRKKISE